MRLVPSGMDDQIGRSSIYSKVRQPNIHSAASIPKSTCTSVPTSLCTCTLVPSYLRIKPRLISIISISAKKVCGMGLFPQPNQLNQAVHACHAFRASQKSVWCGHKNEEKRSERCGLCNVCGCGRPMRRRW